MLGKTHVSFGLFLGALSASGVAVFSETPSLESLVVFYAGVALGALLPDIDEPNSLLGKKTLGISNVLKSIFGHRGFTHSIAFVAALGALLALICVFLQDSFSINANTLFKEIPYFNTLTKGLFGNALNALNIGHIYIFSFALTIGCLFHILGDMMTISGVPLLLPFSSKSYHALPKMLCFRTGGVVDILIATLSIGAFVALNVVFLGFN